MSCRVSAGVITVPSCSNLDWVKRVKEGYRFVERRTILYFLSASCMYLIASLRRDSSCAMVGGGGGGGGVLSR